MKFILTSMGGVGFQELVIFLIGVAICFLFFLLIRAIVLWYWKIDKIVENQQIQIRILQEVLDSLRKN
jgi:hypothetical protein